MSVEGERSTPVVNNARSMQSRVSNVLAAGLMIALGLGALSWYYANALGRQKRTRQAAMTATVNSAQGEMALPPLGKIDSPVTAESHASAPGPGPATNPPVVVADMPLEQARTSWSASAGSLPPYAGSDHYRPAQRQAAPDRRLSGAAFARESAPTTAPSEPRSADTAAAFPAGQPGTAPVEDRLTTLLRPAAAVPARAQMLPTLQFLLPKGAFVDCTLETAIDSTLPGMTTCVTATDTFGVDGKVVLLERGSKLIGETRGEVQSGAARVFVLWTEARTPTGVLVPLDSPGTDELGRAGLPGAVNRHFWDRFGAAMLVSVIDGAMQAVVQSSSRGSGTVVYNPSTSTDAITDVLKGTINIPPTVIKHQGDRIQILVARDLDFRPVYELRTVGR